MKIHVSSSAFVKVLRSSFEEYIQRRPENFRCCPTPECGFIYRCATTSGAGLPGYTCPNCFEPLFTSCHAQHGGYTYAEYKDIASGGLKALEKLKRELNIKDCPKCSTPMEKVDGCNHITCGGCKAHICWVCMSVFARSKLCYDHMVKQHGGIGIELGIGLDEQAALSREKKTRFRLWQTRQFPSLDSIAAISVLAAHLYDYEQS
jgi:hypothetical protein